MLLAWTSLRWPCRVRHLALSPILTAAQIEMVQAVAQSSPLALAEPLSSHHGCHLTFQLALNILLLSRLADEPVDLLLQARNELFRRMDLALQSSVETTASSATRR